MSIYHAYKLGFFLGFAAGAFVDKSTTEKPKGRRTMSIQDASILEFIRAKNMVSNDDILAYLSLANERGNQISVGSSMRRLGWIRRRDHSLGKWIYEPGPAAVSGN